MKFLMYFLCFFALLSCSSEIQSSSKNVPEDKSSPAQKKEAVQQKIESHQDKKSSDRELNRKKKVNTISDEERELRMARKHQQPDLQNALGFASTQKESMNSNVICRRFQGCRRFCSDIYGNNRACNQWPVILVLQSWSNMLKQYDTLQIIDHTEWIGRYRDVVGFLHATDSSNSIFRYITSRLSEGKCESSGAMNLTYLSDVESKNYPHSLYLTRSNDDSQMNELKKIMDPVLFKFDPPLFQGMLNKCLYDSVAKQEKNSSDDDVVMTSSDAPDGEEKVAEDVSLSLVEYMVAHDNEIGFNIAHRVLAQSCGNRNECIQLAYCTIGSDAVWSYIDGNRYRFGLDIEAKPSLCSYEDFHSLPSKFITFSLK